MLKKKDWKELLQEFLDKVDKREQLIQGKIDDLQEQAQIIKTKIKDNSDQMIELEMSEDTTGIEKFKKENRTLRIELEEIQDSIDGYKTQLGTSRDYYAKDMEKIRAAANKAEEERLQQYNANHARLDELQAQIDELKKQMENTRYELRASRTTVEDLKWKFHLIDPRLGEIPSYEQENFIKIWLAGEDTERYFDKKEASPGRNVTHVDMSQGGSDWVNYPSPYSNR
ncbi:hypothetical protein BK138_08510 [Paenibacillus rhizosphaerae]|uniref:Uncharacterized protein n=1 Tax=Paenibacillus rhizosphaerae TaxID=297318 RepID=A0A1R1F396_9BACL|nr:hypothetical protein [Paenibacillus rhizosphaerae]OMF58543.1 hypothetical protein BK138_08510 [Paenibacillus rhizosphaerae]